MRFNVIRKYFVSLFIISFLGISSISNAQAIADVIKNIDNEKYNNAEKMAKELIQREPNNTAAYFYLGKIYLITSKIDLAQQTFEKGLKAKKEDEDVLNNVGMGAIYLAKNDNAKAEETFKEAISESDNNADIVANVADMYLILKKDLEKAKKFVTDSKDNKRDTKNKKSPLLFLKLADIAYAINDNNSAIQNYQYSIDYDNSSIKGRIGIARIYNRVKQYELAENNLKEALGIDSSYSVTFKELGELYYSTRRYEEAANNFQKYLSLTEPSNENQLRYASMLFLAKKYADAIDVLKKIESNNSENPTLYHIMAFSYYSLDNPTEGIAAYNKYFALEKPADITASDYSNYAELLSKAGNDSLAIEALHKALAIDSTDSEIRMTLANTYFKSKKFGDAAREYSVAEAQTKKPLTLRNYFDWGQAYLYDKQYVLADSVFKKITEIKSDFPLGYYYRAISNASQDTTTELGLAKPHYEKFIELAAPTADKYKIQLISAYSYLGYYYFLKKDDPEFKGIWRENYKTNWEKVLELDPANEQATAALENLKILK